MIRKRQNKKSIKFVHNLLNLTRRSRHSVILHLLARRVRR